jgi:hypothetical protein
VVLVVVVLVVVVLVSDPVVLVDVVVLVDTVVVVPVCVLDDTSHPANGPPRNESIILLSSTSVEDTRESSHVALGHAKKERTQLMSVRFAVLRLTFGFHFSWSA